MCGNCVSRVFRTCSSAICASRLPSSADDRQSVDLQRDALVVAGVDERNIHSDKASGAKDDRPGLKACLTYLKEGDGLVLWNTTYLGAVRQHLERTGKPVRLDLLRHFSPLGWQHINLTGDYLWTDPAVPSEALRPLR